MGYFQLSTFVILLVVCVAVVEMQVSKRSLDTSSLDQFPSANLLKFIQNCLHKFLGPIFNLISQFVNYIGA